MHDARVSPSPAVSPARDTGVVVASRVTSTTFVGRAPELAELRAGLTEAVENRPGLAFIAGESGLGKTRLVAELERVARAEGMRVIGGDCVELGEGELPYAPIVTALRPLGPLRPRGLRRAVSARPRGARADPARPRALGGPRGRRGHRAGAAVRRPARVAGAARGRGRAAADDRGPALGRPLHARVPRLSGCVAVPRARAGGDDLPAGRAAPPPPAAPVARRAGARRARPPRRAAPAHARRSWASSSRTSSARRRAATCWGACSRARKATRCSPRSCSRPGRTGAARSRRPCATR